MKIKIFNLFILMIASCAPEPNSVFKDPRPEKALESIRMLAPWAVAYGEQVEPDPLPLGWKKHLARKELVVSYGGSELRIPKGKTYFSYNGKIAIGWHGTYDPPQGM